MTELCRSRGRPPGSFKDTLHKRLIAGESAIDRAGLGICGRLIAFASPRRLLTTPNQDNGISDMDPLPMAPIDLRRMDTIDDVGQALNDVVAAIAEGHLSAREGVLISKIIEARRKSFESIDFKRQLDELSMEVRGERNSKP